MVAVPVFGGFAPFGLNIGAQGNEARYDGS